MRSGAGGSGWTPERFEVRGDQGIVGVNGLCVSSDRQGYP